MRIKTSPMSIPKRAPRGNQSLTSTVAGPMGPAAMHGDKSANMQSPQSGSNSSSGQAETRRSVCISTLMTPSGPGCWGFTAIWANNKLYRFKIKLPCFAVWKTSSVRWSAWCSG